MEALQVINGYKIYKGGTWCEVSKNGENIYSGSCNENVTCKDIYRQVTAKVEFYLKDRLLTSYDKLNDFYGERQSTIELLAFENKCSENEIKVVIKYDDPEEE